MMKGKPEDLSQRADPNLCPRCGSILEIRPKKIRNHKGQLVDVKRLCVVCDSYWLIVEIASNLLDFEYQEIQIDIEDRGGDVDKLGKKLITALKRANLRFTDADRKQLKITKPFDIEGKQYRRISILVPTHRFDDAIQAIKDMLKRMGVKVGETGQGNSTTNL